ncbi:MAG: hypothetical protein MJ180_00155 [Candidatus Gastranaerophilales bacterium]|nr:hypothetical protein [Candidatus Gastranaerophilales bacterium]
MERLFDEITYSNKAIEANEQGKILVIVQKEVEYDVEVLEWNYVEKEITRQKIDPETGEPMFDPETGEPIMETVIIQEPYPKMVEETIIDPETGEESTILVQAHHTETRTKIVEDLEIVDNPEGYDKLTLTPADVERALIKAKGINFDDLKQLISTQMTGVDMKALGAEFGANLFYRGAMFGNGRLFDIVGSLLGYTPDDIDYLFLNKELPVVNEE